MDIKEKWNILEREARECKGCRLCAAVRGFEKGNRNARIMIVGDAPSESGIKNGAVLNEKSTEYVEGFLKLIGISPDDVYFTNLVNCPPADRKTPPKECVEVCIKCLRQQFSLVRPEIVICLGKTVCTRLISPDFKLGTSHGEFIAKGNVMFMGTYSPSSFDYEEKLKADCFDDFLKLQDFIKVYPPFSNKNSSF